MRTARPEGTTDRPTGRPTDKEVELPESLSEPRGCRLREQLDRKDHMGATRWSFPEILWYCTRGAMQSVQELETDGLVAGRAEQQNLLHEHKIIIIISQQIQCSHEHLLIKMEFTIMNNDKYNNNDTD